jgi:hypothetical protein
MSHYTANVNAFLYMGAATTDPLPAPGSDTFTVVPLLGSVTPPGNEQSTGSFNVLNTTSPYSIGGKVNERTVTGNVVADWTSTVHQAMEADSIVPGRKRNWYIIYPDANTRRDDFVGFVSSWVKEPFDAGEDAKEHRVNFTITVDGAVTVTY